MDSITHFSHDHSLHLLQQKPTEAEKRCYACEVALNQEKEHLVQVYGCELCENFFLHKHCAQLPMEIVHKLHQNHSLFLVLKPPGSYYEGRCNCSPELDNGCPLRPYLRHFFYYCYGCDFLLDTKCAFRLKHGIISCKKEVIFHHPSHKQHQLMVLPRPASFLCDACGVTGKIDLFYHCFPCQYWIHKGCAMLPTTTTHHIHKHPLILSFIGLPSHHRTNFKFFCDICGYLLNAYTNGFWVYYCDLCRYFVHIRCMGKKKKQIEVDLEGLHIEDLPHLPVTDKSEELIRRYLVKDDIQPVPIQLLCHKHPLVYSNDQFPEDGEEILCDACVEPIFSPPYYHCAECRHFLHLTCAKLPSKLQLPIHSHQLSLRSKRRLDDLFRCNRCKRFSNGLFFYCTTEGCEFYLDLSCAALPKVILLENHNHPLVQLPGEMNKNVSCRGCSRYYDGIIDECWMGCIPCNFFVETKCVLLPKKVKHRYDSKHPLILKFPPHDYHPDPFDCYQCEKEINPTYWLYHCVECDLSFHVECINAVAMVSYKDFNTKFGQRVQIGSHPHPLQFVSAASVSSSKCHKCEGHNPYLTLECETCNFRICIKCIWETELPR